MIYEETDQIRVIYEAILETGGLSYNDVDFSDHYGFEYSSTGTAHHR